MVLQQKLHAITNRLHLANKAFAMSVTALMEDGVEWLSRVTKNIFNGYKALTVFFAI